MSIRLDGLADAWEAESSIRFCSRQTGRLVQWPEKPDAVGIPTMFLAFHWMEMWFRILVRFPKYFERIDPQRVNQ